MSKIKYLLIIIVSLLLSCSDIVNDCHTCKGLSPSYQSRQESLLKSKKISYETFLSNLSKARDCKEVVCGADYCEEHD